MTLAWKSDIQSGRKMVLLALCDNANDQGECYPSVSMVAKKCSMSERSVFNHIAELEKSGAIQRQNRTGRSTIYHLDPCKFCTPADSAPITIKEPSIEPKKKKEPATQAFIFPEWINKKHWDAWHSCAKRKNASDQQKQLAVDKLDSWRLAGIDHAAALENAAIGGWQGLFEPEKKTAPKTAASNTSKYAGAAKAIWGDNESRTINA